MIDPTTPASGITYNQMSPATLTPVAVPNTPPSGKGLFKNLRGDSGTTTASANWENSNHQPLHLFSKLNTTFTRDYASTLHSLSYSNPRTSTPSNPSIGTIAHLPVRLGLTTQPINDPDRWHEGPYCHIYIAACENVDHYRAKVRPAIRAFVNQIEGSGIGIKDDSNHGGGVGGGSSNHTSAPPAPPASAVGPSSTSTPSTPSKKGGKLTANEKALSKAGMVASKSVDAGNFGRRYIIVFVPTGASSSTNAGGNAASGTGGTAGGGGGGGFGGFRAGRKGGAGVVSPAGGMDINSGHRGHAFSDDASATAATTSSSTNDGVSNNNHSAAASAALPPGPIAHSSKEVKELYHKFMKDFPNGRTVILGTLQDGVTGATSVAGSGKEQVAAMSPLKNQEWKAFLHNLGGAIVDGFGDRVRRYDEELRRLDGRRAAFVRKLSGSRSPGDLDDNTTFDLSHFFLVKESLAFSYEQMQLPDEAKLQYEELEAFLPEETWRKLAQVSGSGAAEKNDEEKGGTSPSDLAMAGDSEGFRHYIKTSGQDLRGVSRLVPQYMYARETRLLFQMGSTVDVLARSKDFLLREHRNRLSDVSLEFGRRWKEEMGHVSMNSSSEEVLSKQTAMKRERYRREAEVEAWALSSCWDIKCASKHYFSFASASETSQEGGNNSASPAIASTVEERDAARFLAEILDFAILRLNRLGDLAIGEEEGKVNPIRKATSERPVDTLQPWEPWRELQQRRGEIKQKKIESRKNDGSDWSPTLPSGVSTWLRNAFADTSSFEETYLELADAAVLFNRLAGRFRFASRLEDHRAEVHISRGEYDLAANVLSNNVGACARDQWNRAHYWRIFRLACCQRMSGDVLAYLETLTQSFNPRLSSVAPKKTSSLFQRDLEAIVTDAAVAEPRWGAFPFLETELSIESETAGKTSQLLPFLRRKLTKHLSFVGDELTFTLSINSHLPRSISVNGIRLYLVTFEKYEQVYRRNGIVTEDDAFRILSVDAPITIEPGKNQFSFFWQPMTYSTYVLATVEIQWKEASFFYDSALLRKPMIGVDVQPSEPTQTIELNPLFLIPGHVQNVRLVFQSGSDIITEGVVKLSCSDGLQVVPPKTDPSKLDDSWSDECIIPLASCEPGKKIVITTLVKSASVKHDDDTDNVQTMRAIVETLYRQESYSKVLEKGEEPESRPMKTLLEAMVTTLDRPALTVDDAEAFEFGDDHVMVNISLQCNSPVPFYIKEWYLDLPLPLQLDEGGDFNEGMFGHAIPEGEMLLLGFRCIRCEDSNKQFKRPVLRVVLQDDFGKTFLQVLPLNLEDIYKQLRKEDMYAESYNATAELTCSAKEGTVGHPVPFVYNVDLQSLISPKRKANGHSIASDAGCPILYTILSEGSDWIVSGKVQGLLDLSSQSETITLQVRGIPTQSGILRNFPELFLEYLPAGKDAKNFVTPPITVQCRNPECFKSMAYTTSLSLAVPAGVDEF